MKRINMVVGLMAVAIACVCLLLSPQFSLAHCDTLDGPVIKDARTALEKDDITPVLKWVQKKDEAKCKWPSNRR